MTTALTANASKGVEDNRPLTSSRITPAANADRRTLTGDEILGLEEFAKLNSSDPPQKLEDSFDSDDLEHSEDERLKQVTGSERDQKTEQNALHAILANNPDLKRAWEDAEMYRKTFATPEEARRATTLLAELDRMDALFFSRRAEDHTQLARSIAELDPIAFASLAKAIDNHAKQEQAAAKGTDRLSPQNDAAKAVSNLQVQASKENTGRQPPKIETPGLSPKQMEFLQSTNAAAVKSVLDAISSQVERLLPDGASKNAHNRMVGEVYRELDLALRGNESLSKQLREALRSGGLDESHHRAIVSLMTGRARQALPGVAKRVMNEWTSTVMAASQHRRTRQHAAERRVDIAGSAGSGGDTRRSMMPRDIDYERMSDADILNL